MKIFYDTEFLEDGETIRLISIAMVREDGKSIYRIVEDNELMIDVWNHNWLRHNVVPSLPISSEYEMLDLDGTHKPLVVWESDHPDYKYVDTRDGIATDIQRFILDTPHPELWAYYAAYDHVALCQLWGRMVDLPNGIPMYTNDLKSEIVRLGALNVPKQSEGLHNALQDAIWNKMTYEYLHENRPVSRAIRALQDSFDRGSRD
jgi:hypothetical protein